MPAKKNTFKKSEHKTKPYRVFFLNPTKKFIEDLQQKLDEFIFLID